MRDGEGGPGEMGPREGLPPRGMWDERQPGPEEVEEKGLAPAHLSAQLGRTLPSQRGPWKPVAQRQAGAPGLSTQVPPLRHGAGERGL